MPMGIALAGNHLELLAYAYRYATQVMVANMIARDDGIGAFIEKRTPHWKSGNAALLH